MPVTFQVASHPANAVRLPKDGPKHAQAFLEKACKIQGSRCKELLQSSIEGDNLTKICPNSNGFVYAALEAYGSHHHLRIRPDDVWLAILVQLNFYINAHAEELRPLFVAHKGKKRLIVKTVGDRYTVNYAKLAQTFTKRIHENVVDDTLVEWILPNFTTTTVKDTTVCSVVMMATLKEYFEYIICIVCGIPSITLEGERSDWEEIYRRLWRLYDLGKEPAVWAEMLRPIVRRFVTAFDGPPDEAFWKHIMYRANSLCGKDDLSGWITGFCVWSNKGQWKGGDLPQDIPVKPEYVPILPPNADPSASTASSQPAYTAASTAPAPSPAAKRLDKVIPKWLRRHSKSPMPKVQEKASTSGSATEDAASETVSNTNAPSMNNTNAPSEEGSVMIPGPAGYDSPAYTLDGVRFFDVPVSSIPPGYAEVDVTVDDNGNKLRCKMVAGHVAFAASASPGGVKIDTVSPEAHWFIFEKK